nr:MAG TPA: lysozyme [Caudoviricetes sp.]
MPEIIGGFNDVDLESSKTKLQEALNIDNGTGEDNTVINNVVQSPDSIIRKYGILQDVVIQSSDEDILVKAQSALNDHNLPEETVSVTILCSIDEIFDYKVGYGIHLLFPYYKQYEDCFMYIKDVSSKFFADGKFSCTLTLTPSRVMDEQDFDSEEEDTNTTDILIRIVNYTKQFLGVPYVWGGTTPSGFDCSGLVQYVYNHFSEETGVTLTRTTQTQWNQKDLIAIDKTNQNSWQEGDLLYFGTKGEDPTHVGMYIGNGEFIHAPQTGDVVKIALVSSKTNLLGVRRVVDASKLESSESDSELGSGISTKAGIRINGNYFTTALLPFIEKSEGFSAEAYQNSTGWYIGFGFAKAYYPDLFPNGNKSTITKAKAEQVLIDIMNNLGKQIEAYAKKNGTLLMPWQMDGLIGAGYQLGIGTIQKYILPVVAKKGDIYQAFCNANNSIGGHLPYTLSCYEIFKSQKYRPFNS